MTQEQKDRVETALVNFIEKAAKNSSNAEVATLPGAVHALVTISGALVTRKLL